MSPSTDFATTIKNLTSDFKESLKEFIERIITYHDAKVDKKYEKQIQTLSL